MSFNLNIYNADTLSISDVEKANVHMEILGRRLERNKQYNETSYTSMLARESSIEDYLITYSQIKMDADDKGISTVIAGNNYKVDKNALNQMATKLGIPNKYTSALWNEKSLWANNLLAKTIEEHAFNKRFHDITLLRTTENDKLMATLSQSYDRYNTATVMNRLLESVKDKIYVTNVDYDGYSTYIEVVRKDLVPIAMDGVVHFYLFGAHIRNSSFGRSAFEVKPFVLQVVCNNGLTRERVLHQAHNGSKMSGMIGHLSKETMTMRNELKVRYGVDALKFVFSDAVIDAEIEKIASLSTAVINADVELSKLRKSKKVTVEESKSILDIIGNADSSEGLLGNNSVYDMVQAITRFSQTKEPERRAQLNDLAGSISISRAS